MHPFYVRFFTELGAKEQSAGTLSFWASLITAAVLCFVVTTIVRYFLIRIITKTSAMTKTLWDDILLKKKFFHRLSDISVIIILYIFEEDFKSSMLTGRIIGMLTILIFLALLNTVINSADEIYRGYQISRIKPMRGLMQVIKVTLYIVGGILITAILTGENPLIFIGGIGAFAAVISFIFKDAILGFAAGIQLSANDMLRIGDWIEMPEYHADGTVVDLSLTAVKVENFDRTITTVPAYALVSDAFINRRNMIESGARRIKRAIHIDAGGVRPCDGEMLEKMRKIALLRDYIETRLKEIESHNENLDADMSVRVNGRRLTNLGTFRVYIIEYLRQHPGIRKDMALMARQLESNGDGIPLEIYAFADTVRWDQYEGIQADIFDHLYAVAREFGLEVYQHPSGSDFRRF